MYGTQAFYMRQNEDGKTVAAMDLLVPKVHIDPVRRGQACINIVSPDHAPETCLPRRFSLSFLVLFLSPGHASICQPLYTLPPQCPATPMMSQTVLVLIVSESFVAQGMCRNALFFRKRGVYAS
jgi:hypothetical protein